MSKHILVLTTISDEEKGKEIASELVRERLAACVTLTAKCFSFYWWEGKITQEEEYILFIKTKKEMYKRLEEKLRQIHPYQVPEIIAFPIIKGFTEYLAWIERETF
ncbi:MAG: divalent-cation tolerance protein CutA [Candidatus Aminicenantia bacterium]